MVTESPQRHQALMFGVYTDPLKIYLKPLLESTLLSPCLPVLFPLLLIHPRLTRGAIKSLGVCSSLSPLRFRRAHRSRHICLNKELLSNAQLTLAPAQTCSSVSTGLRSGDLGQCSLKGPHGPHVCGWGVREAPSQHRA